MATLSLAENFSDALIEQKILAPFPEIQKIANDDKSSLKKSKKKDTDKAQVAMD